MLALSLRRPRTHAFVRHQSVQQVQALINARLAQDPAMTRLELVRIIAVMTCSSSHGVIVAIVDCVIVCLGVLLLCARQLLFYAMMTCTGWQSNRGPARGCVPSGTSDAPPCELTCYFAACGCDVCACFGSGASRACVGRACCCCVRVSCLRNDDVHRIATVSWTCKELCFLRDFTGSTL